MSNKVFWLLLTGVVVGLVGTFMLLGEQPSTQSGNSTNLSKEEILQPDHYPYTLGNEESKVILIEYGDFQCPFCGALHPLISQLLAEYGDRIQFQYRHFPITAIHNNAMVSHRAAEAAGLQDKFYEMYDKIFVGQAEWSESNEPGQIFERYAKEIGLDVDKFNKDRNSQKVLDTIQTNLSEAVKLDVSSTPTLFLNGEKMETPTSYEALVEPIEKALSENKQ